MVCVPAVLGCVVDGESKVCGVALCCGSLFLVYLVCVGLTVLGLLGCVVEGKLKGFALRSAFLFRTWAAGIVAEGKLHGFGCSGGPLFLT